ncbi:alkaline phosphatase PhoX [Actinomadura kijaniata]|uniref:alkaline phosphatase PhoX n=1 Tax=Actinomadura kijaniata TaxID=46161 RepID=UPI0008371F95|nr:alkaline phosphatase PhoX [Actinomadura kijaniata]
MERRHFLAGGATLAAGAALGLGGPFQGVAAHAETRRRHRGYGGLRPVRDLRDGKVRLHLPEGFRYRSFNPAGSPLSDGSTTPGKHDGMAAFRGPRGSVVLVRNHEVNGPVGAFGDRSAAYDPMAGGGTCTLRVTPWGEVLDARVSLNGTQMNCSGGPMPWGSWVTCEETVNGPDVGNDFSGADNTKLTQRHGYLFEVPVHGEGERAPIRSAGRFAHESAACDPRTGAIYLTEDCFDAPSGFYRYLPPKNPMRAGRLLDGGRLQMLAVRGRPNADLSQGQPKGVVYETTWVDIDDPDPTWTGKPTNAEALTHVSAQGRAQGAALFSRLEGAIHDRGVVYFCSTQGGAPVTQPVPDGFGDGRGQIWAYDTRSGRLRLVVESPSADLLDLPDNITHSRRGALVLCEDGDEANYLRGLTTRGSLFDFARMEPVAEDAGAEFAGSTFSPDGGTLFVNIQSKVGMSLAIWGPWHRGPF